MTDTVRRCMRLHVMVILAAVFGTYACVIFTVDCSHTIPANVTNVDKRVISGFRRGVDEIFDLLGCYVAYIGSYLRTFLDNLPIPSSKV